MNSGRIYREWVRGVAVSLIMMVFLSFDSFVAFGEVREVVAQHIAALGNDDYQVRWEALGELSKLGSDAEPAVPTLIGLLTSNLDRFWAIHVLGEIGPGASPAVPALIDYLEYLLTVEEEKRFKDESTAIGIIQTLGKIGPMADAAIPILRKALKDEVSSIRYFSANALGQLGPSAIEAIPDLQAQLNDHEYVGLYEYPHGNDVADAASQTLDMLRTSGQPPEPSEAQ